jgi:hypothetical protein
MRRAMMSVVTILLASSLFAAPCPGVTGDFAPATIDTNTTPPTRYPDGDCQVTVADAQALVEVALGNEQFAKALVDVTVRGTVQPDGTISSGTGFGVKFFPAGDGGTELPGKVSVLQGSTSVAAASGQNPDFQNQVSPGQYLMIDGGFVLVASVSSATQLTLKQGYGGATNANAIATRDMTLFNAYAISFDDAFGDTPTVVLTAQGQTPKPGETPAFNVMQLDARASNGAVDSGGFRCFLFQSPFGPYLPGGTAPFDFVAIGQK